MHVTEGALNQTASSLRSLSFVETAIWARFKCNLMTRMEKVDGD